MVKGTVKSHGERQRGERERKKDREINEKTLLAAVEPVWCRPPSRGYCQAI